MSRTLSWCRHLRDHTRKRAQEQRLRAENVCRVRRAHPQFSSLSPRLPSASPPHSVLFCTSPPLGTGSLLEELAEGRGHDATFPRLTRVTLSNIFRQQRAERQKSCAPAARGLTFCLPLNQSLLTLNVRFLGHEVTHTVHSGSEIPTTQVSFYFPSSPSPSCSLPSILPSPRFRTLHPPLLFSG